MNNISPMHIKHLIRYLMLRFCVIVSVFREHNCRDIAAMLIKGRVKLYFSFKNRVILNLLNL
jgi:hypothetical protein